MASVSTTQPANPDPNNLPEGVYLWPVDKDQSDRLSAMLKTDFPAMRITGTYVVGPQIKCEGCGKLSGLDDFISGALKYGIHDTKFMINALETGGENNTPAHKLECCVCGKTFLECNSITAMAKQTSWIDFAKDMIGAGSALFWTPAVIQDAAQRHWPRLQTMWTHRAPLDQAAGDEVANRRWNIQGVWTRHVEEGQGGETEEDSPAKRRWNIQGVWTRHAEEGQEEDIPAKRRWNIVGVWTRRAEGEQDDPAVEDIPAKRRWNIVGVWTRRAEDDPAQGEVEEDIPAKRRWNIVGVWTRRAEEGQDEPVQGEVEQGQTDSPEKEAVRRWTTIGDWRRREE